MNWRLIPRAPLLALLAMFAVAFPAPCRAGWGSASHVDQWRVLGATTTLNPGTAYGLFNLFNERGLRHKTREYGIDLVWDETNQSRDFTFRRRDGGAGAVRYGDILAIQVAGGGYLRYQERKYGINLVWSDAPVYEWEITGGVTGTNVPVAAEPLDPLESAVRLYNRTHGDYVLYGERDYGVNLRWYSDVIEGRGYPPLPFPPSFRSPGGEPGQILLSGRATRVNVFHGRSDDELDWHVHVELDSEVQRQLFDHLLAHGSGAKRAHPGPVRDTPLTIGDLDDTYAEWMVLDGYKNTNTDELFYSADVTRILMLGRPAWNYSVRAGWHQGESEDPHDSRIVNEKARVYLQGPLVNDAEHRFLVEIHPLDSMAYAVDSMGAPIEISPSASAWPRDTVTWRVAAFSNSRFHRIDGAEYLQSNRTSTWRLALPRGANRTGSNIRVTVTSPGFDNHEPIRDFDDRRITGVGHYDSYRVAASSWAIEPGVGGEPAKLRVTVQMLPPDRWGGMFLNEFELTLR